MREFLSPPTLGGIQANCGNAHRGRLPFCGFHDPNCGTSMPFGAVHPIWLTRKCGFPITYYRASHATLPVRATRDSAAQILKAEGAQKHETILVGNEESDMRAGVNNKLLLVRPEWYPSNISYRFAVVAISNWLSLPALRVAGASDFLVGHRVATASPSHGPFSTMRPDLAVFGNSARDAAKFGSGDTRFWFLMVVSSLYF